VGSRSIEKLVSGGSKQMITSGMEAVLLHNLRVPLSYTVSWQRCVKTFLVLDEFIEVH
jgi:hypothetical protein